MAPERVVPVQAEEAAYVAHRIAIFDELYAKQKQEIADKPRDAITVTLPDGKEIPGQAWETSPATIARGISKSLLDRTVIARVDGELWDMGRPLEGSCKLEFLDFNNDEAKKVFWHSSAHILGEAAEKKFHCHLCFGPPTDDGFFYDFGMPTAGTAVTADDKKTLSSLMEGIVKERQPFERLVMSKEDLLRMFSNNKFKIELINSKIPDGESTTVYRNGPLIDLCRGPHVIDTGRIKALTVLKIGASYFLGDAKNAPLQRVYGISFPDKKLLQEHLKFLEEAAKRDHRRIGKDQDLFMFHELSPGSPFFLPHGMRIINSLKGLINKEYHRRGYVEVMSPNMFNADLWKQSGHWGRTLSLPRHSSSHQLIEMQTTRTTCSPLRSTSSSGVCSQNPPQDRCQLTPASHEAHELPRPLPHLRRQGAVLPRAPPAHGRVWRPAQKRGVRRPVGPHPRPPLHSGRLAHLLPRGPDRLRDLGPV